MRLAKTLRHENLSSGWRSAAAGRLRISGGRLIAANVPVRNPAAPALRRGAGDSTVREAIGATLRRAPR